MKLRHTAINLALLGALPTSRRLFALNENEASVAGGSEVPAPGSAAPARPSAPHKVIRKAKPAKAAKKSAKKLATKGKAKKARKAANGAVAMDALKKARKDYHVDKKVKTAGGNVSVDSGDATAKKLRGMDLGKVYEMAAKVKDVSAGTLKNKYKHLNVGAQRMTLGNIIRAAA